MGRLPRARVLPIAVAALALGLPAMAGAQGLGDAAAKERQKHKTAKPARVYDNDDLQAHKPPGQQASAETAVTPAAPAAAEPLDEAPSGAEAAQAARVSRAEADLHAAEERVQRIQARTKELQDMLNPMSPSFIYGAAKSGDAAGDEMRAKEELARQPSELAAAQRAVEEARLAVDKARSAGSAGR